MFVADLISVKKTATPLKSGHCKWCTEREFSCDGCIITSRELKVGYSDPTIEINGRKETEDIPGDGYR